jgi:SAM-dependent methyltransferase
VGQTVFVRSKSSSENGRRGRIVLLEDKDAEADATKSDRCHIEWEQDSDSSEKDQSSTTIPSVSVARKRLLPVDTSTCSSASVSESPVVNVIVTATTQKFRLLAQSHTVSTDHVLELGCSSGETSTILWQYCASWVGFDTSSNMIQKVKDLLVTVNKKNNKKSKKQQTQTTASASCYQLNALADPATAVEHACQYSGSAGPTVIYLDIGGNREEAGVIRMMQWILQSFPKVHTVIIKSQEVHKALSNTDKCDIGTGEFAGGNEWFQDRLQVAVTATLPRHPLQAPKMLSPVDNKTPICRYHNYFKDGCGKGDICPYDHEHCHLCLKTGHIATECPLLQR